MKRPFLFSLLLLLMGCTVSKYSSLVNPNIDLNQYRTFFCLNCIETADSKIPLYDNIDNRKALRAAIQNEMEKIGYVQQEENPDLIVLLEFYVQDFVDTTGRNTTSYRYWQGREVIAYNYKMGTVKVSLVDRVESTLVWQGSANGILDKEPKRSNQRIDKAIKMIFKEYPIQAVNN